MATPATAAPKALWAGRVIGALALLFLLFDAVVKLLRLAPAVEGTVRLGYPEGLVFGIGVLELICVAAYAVPAFSVLGAILLTAYLGGATATHVRAGSDLFSVLFPGIVGLLLWAALLLRDQRLLALVPVRR